MQGSDVLVSTMLSYLVTNLGNSPGQDHMVLVLIQYDTIPQLSFDEFLIVPEVYALDRTGTFPS